MVSRGSIDVHDDWVKRLAEGDLVAFEALYLQFSKKIYNTARKMRLSHEDAEEIVQEVFMKIWQKKERLDPELSFNAYLLSMVKSLVLKKFRKEAYFLAYQKYHLHVSSPDASPEPDLIFQDLYSHSIELIEKLPSGQREIFSLRYLKYLSIDEISSQLNLSKRTVENQLYRASKTIRKKMEEVNIISWIPFLMLVDFIVDQSPIF